MVAVPGKFLRRKGQEEEEEEFVSTRRRSKKEKRRGGASSAKVSHLMWRPHIAMWKATPTVCGRPHLLYVESHTYCM